MKTPLASSSKPEPFDIRRRIHRCTKKQFPENNAFFALAQVTHQCEYETRLIGRILVSLRVKRDRNALFLLHRSDRFECVLAMANIILQAPLTNNPSSIF
jgi:hypothetical protein